MWITIIANRWDDGKRTLYQVSTRCNDDPLSKKWKGCGDIWCMFVPYLALSNRQSFVVALKFAAYPTSAPSPKLKNLPWDQVRCEVEQTTNSRPKHEGLFTWQGARHGAHTSPKDAAQVLPKPKQQEAYTHDTCKYETQKQEVIISHTHKNLHMHFILQAWWIDALKKLFRYCTWRRQGCYNNTVTYKARMPDPAGRKGWGIFVGPVNRHLSKGSRWLPVGVA